MHPAMLILLGLGTLAAAGVAGAAKRKAPPPPLPPGVPEAGTEGAPTPPLGIPGLPEGMPTSVEDIIQAGIQKWTSFMADKEARRAAAEASLSEWSSLLLEAVGQMPDEFFSRPEKEILAFLDEKVKLPVILIKGRKVTTNLAEVVAGEPAIARLGAVKAAADPVIALVRKRWAEVQAKAMAARATRRAALMPTPVVTDVQSVSGICVAGYEGDCR